MCRLNLQSCHLLNKKLHTHLLNPHSPLSMYSPHPSVIYPNASNPLPQPSLQTPLYYNIPAASRPYLWNTSCLFSKNRAVFPHCLCRLTSFRTVRMMDDNSSETIRGNSCLISLMITFNAVVNLCSPIAFLWICFMKFKFHLKKPGPVWIFVRSEFVP